MTMTQLWTLEEAGSVLGGLLGMLVVAAMTAVLWSAWRPALQLKWRKKKEDDKVRTGGCTRTDDDVPDDIVRGETAEQKGVSNIAAEFLANYNSRHQQTLSQHEQSGTTAGDEQARSGDAEGPGTFETISIIEGRLLANEDKVAEAVQSLADTKSRLDKVGKELVKFREEVEEALKMSQDDAGGGGAAEECCSEGGGDGDWTSRRLKELSQRLVVLRQQAREGMLGEDVLEGKPQAFYLTTGKRPGTPRLRAATTLQSTATGELNTGTEQ